MWLPMAVLAVGSVTSGYLLYHDKALYKWLSPLFEDHGEHEELLKPIVVSALALTMVAIGVSIAVYKYMRENVDSTAPVDVSFITKFVRKDLMQDQFNEKFFMRPGQLLTKGLVKTEDVVVDGTVRAVARMAIGSGSGLRGLQNGFVRSYAALILIGALALIAAIWVVVS
jgi:NADH-quinone oxidoreductase subunit L